MAKNKLVSIVIPCYNEEKNINRTFDGLLEVAEKHPFDFEIIAINDGSKDNTWNVIEEHAKKHKKIKGINLMVNHGMSQAYQAGFDLSKGDYVITVAADLEIPLKNIKKVVMYLEDGYDFVNTHRKGRWGGGGRKLGSRVANGLITKISGVSMKDTGSGMKGFTRNMIESLHLYGEMHRFIPAYLSTYGARMKEFDVEFKDRDFGVSAYGSSKRTVKVFLDLATLYFMLYFSHKPFRAMPGRLFGFTGIVISGLGGLIGVYLVVLKALGESIGNRPLLTLSVVMVIVGVQSVMMGMIGELLMRIYFESSGKKNYTVRETVG
jgi:glycosyltransferase involved in cell wall biosynthesis